MAFISLNYCCFDQLLPGFFPESDEYVRKQLTSRLYDDQFVDDFMTIIGKRDENLYFGEWLIDGLVSSQKEINLNVDSPLLSQSTQLII